jgi:hypothetical protein
MVPSYRTSGAAQPRTAGVGYIRPLRKPHRTARGRLEPVAPATIFIAFAERHAIMTAGCEIPKYRRDEVESIHELSFEVT